MYEQNTSMMNTPERNTFLLPAMVEGDFSSDEIAEDADGLQMMSFQRVKIPAGGALQFEIPTEDPDNPDYPFGRSCPPGIPERQIHPCTAGPDKHNTYLFENSLRAPKP